MRRICFSELILAAALALAVALSVSLHNPARAAEADGSWYVTVFGGANFMQDPQLELFGLFEFDGDAHTGALAGSAVGYRVSPMVRTELELSAGRNEVDVFGIDVDVTTFAVFANGYLDIDLGTLVTPYVGLGIGAVHIADDVIDRENLVPAGQVLLGVTVPLTDELRLRGGYRYRRTAGGQLGPIDFPEGLGSHIVEAGLTWEF